MKKNVKNIILRIIIAIIVMAMLALIAEIIVFKSSFRKPVKTELKIKEE